MSDMIKTALAEQGEFAGWLYYPDEPYESETVGPIYFRTDAAGPVVAARIERRHLNAGGVAHGGFLMSMADVALFAIAHEHLDGGYGVTVAFTSEFLSGPKEGDRVEARGEVLRAGGSLIFARGLIRADDRPVLSFSGTLKKLRPKG